jgi:hypothetical protein
MIRFLMFSMTAATIAWADAVIAGEGPTSEERARIEAALRQHGFMRWGEIEREDSSTWEWKMPTPPTGTNMS